MEKTDTTELDLALRRRDRRQSRNAVLVVLGLGVFAVVLVVINATLRGGADEPVKVRTIEDMRAAR